MKILKWIIGGIFTLALIFTLLLTSLDIVLYYDWSFFEKEYTKYDVAKDVHMEMEDLLLLTDEMMDYLKGDRDDLMIKTQIDGQEDYFFNEREIAHMVDVKDLFLAGYMIRRICIIILFLSILILMLTKTRLTYVLTRSLKIGIIIFALLTAALSIIMAFNFTKVFTIFHEVFFTNDLWLLNPATDRLINILPEGFFIDIAIRTGVIFAILLIVIFIIAIIFEHAIIRKNKKVTKL